MSDADSKIIVLAEHPKARASWGLVDVEQLLSTEKQNLQTLNDLFSKQPRGSHRLKKIRDIRDAVLCVQGKLDQISDWLDEKSEESGVDQEKLKRLQESCKKLIDRSERFKKSVADDMADRRHEENKWRLNPLQAFGTLVGIVGGAVTLAKGQDEAHQNFIFGTAGALISAGIYAAFRQPMHEIFDAAGRAAVKAATKMTVLRKDIRGSAFAVTLYATALTTEKKDIVPRYPSQNTTRAKMIIVARP